MGMEKSVPFTHWAVWSKQEAEKSLWDKDLFSYGVMRKLRLNIEGRKFKKTELIV